MTDLAHRLRAYPMVGVPPAFATYDVAYVAHESSIGRIVLARKDSGPLVASVFASGPVEEDRVLDRLATTVGPRVLRRPRALDEVRHRLDDYLGGRRHGVDVEVDWALATPWQRIVLTTLADRVPFGSRTTYGDLARWTGRPGAARAVGVALRGNPLCLVVPCHRVVGARGELTGYAGGLAAKARLLDLESAPA